MEEMLTLFGTNILAKRIEPGVSQTKSGLHITANTQHSNVSRGLVVGSSKYKDKYAEYDIIIGDIVYYKEFDTVNVDGKLYDIVDAYYILAKEPPLNNE